MAQQMGCVASAVKEFHKEGNVPEIGVDFTAVQQRNAVDGILEGPVSLVFVVEGQPDILGVEWHVTLHVHDGTVLIQLFRGPFRAAEVIVHYLLYGLGTILAENGILDLVDRRPQDGISRHRKKG